MKCPECLVLNEDDATKCSSCGYKFEIPEGSSTPHEDFVGRYFGFRKLITPTLIKWTYGFGALAITATCVIAIISPDTFTNYGRDSSKVMFGGILALILGNLVWRMICEGAILLFSLHEVVVSIEDKAKILAAEVERKSTL